MWDDRDLRCHQSLETAPALCHQLRFSGLPELPLMLQRTLEALWPQVTGQRQPTWSVRVQMSTMRVIWVLDSTRARPGQAQSRSQGPWVPIQRTYVLGVPGPIAQRCPGQEGNVSHNDGEQQQGADDLPGYPPVEARPPPGHPCYVITEPARDIGLGSPTGPTYTSPPAQPAVSSSITKM